MMMMILTTRLNVTNTQNFGKINYDYVKRLSLLLSLEVKVQHSMFDLIEIVLIRMPLTEQKL